VALVSRSSRCRMAGASSMLRRQNRSTLARISEAELGPPKGPRAGIVLVDKAGNGGFWGGGTLIHDAAELPVGQQGKEAPDLVDLARTCRRQIDTPAWPFGGVNRVRARSYGWRSCPRSDARQARPAPDREPPQSDSLKLLSIPEPIRTTITPVRSGTR
jgi:hypothetical protein